MEREIKINVPEGYEIDREKSTFEKIVFKPIEKKLPECWEDLGEVNGYWSDGSSGIQRECGAVVSSDNRNVWPTYEEAEASLYLAMLLQLRDAYNGDWVPDWDDPEQPKHVIVISGDNPVCNVVFHVRRSLVFKSPELQKKFILFPKIKEYILKAAPLL
jgi:hypothetical protein